MIFRRDADREYYLEQLEEYRQCFKVYAYVLMSNHVHFLIETGKVALGATDGIVYNGAPIVHMI